MVATLLARALLPPGALEASVVREALGQYLGRTDLGSAKGANR